MKTNIFKVAAILLGACCSMQLSATSWYVETTGSDTNDGMTQETSFETIEQAFRAKSPGDTINIGEGTFTVSQTIEWDESLYIMGAGKELTIVQASETYVEDMENSFTYGVFFNQASESCIDQYPLSVLSGMTIRHGAAPIYEYNTTTIGGGIKNYANLYVNECIIEYNTALNGAAIYNAGMLKIENSIVRYNHAFNIEGGIFNESSASNWSYEEINCEIYDNTQDEIMPDTYEICDFESGFSGTWGTNGNPNNGAIEDNVNFTIVDNPDTSGTNDSQKVGKFHRLSTGLWWAYAWFDFEEIQIIASSDAPRYIHIQFYKPVASKICVQLKGPDISAPELTSTSQQKTYEWQEVIFEFTTTGAFDMIEIKADFESSDSPANRLDGDIDIYIDNIVINSSSDPLWSEEYAGDLPETFETNKHIFESDFFQINWNIFGQDIYISDLEIVENPDNTGVNGSNTCAKFHHRSDGLYWSGVNANPISPMVVDAENHYLHVMVYREYNDSYMSMKLDTGSPVSTSGDLLLPPAEDGEGKWVDYVFELSEDLYSSYTRIAFMLDFTRSDFGVTRNEERYVYIDEVEITNDPTPRVIVAPEPDAPIVLLGEYDFPTTTASLAASNVHELAEMSNITYSNSIAYDYNASNGYFRPNGWPEGDYEDDKYLQFEVTPVLSRLTLNSIELTHKPNNATLGPQTIGVCYSTDGGNSFSEGIEVAVTSRTAFNTDVLELPAIETEYPILFNIYGCNSLQGTAAQYDYWIINNIQLYGTASTSTVSSIQETACAVRCYRNDKMLSIQGVEMPTIITVYNIVGEVVAQQLLEANGTIELPSRSALYIVSVNTGSYNYHLKL